MSINRRAFLKNFPASIVLKDSIVHGLEQQIRALGEKHEFFKPARPVSVASARDTTIGFTRYTFHGFEESWHHGLLGDFLDRFVAGDIQRGMIFLPPRHSKSEFVSRRLPARIFGKRPSAKIIAASYTSDLATLMSRDVQRIIDSPAYRGLYPETEIRGKRTDAFFEVNGGEGYYRAAGVNVGIAGMGASYGLIDDPIKDAAEANSQVYREAVWNWYTSTFYTRLEQPGSILLTMTRWHEDDLAGRLLKRAREDPQADQWEVLDLPARAVDDCAYGPRPDSEFRAIGEALWPARFGDDRLSKIERALGDWWFPLYQQRPGAPGGTKFKREWLEIIEPAQIPAGWTKRAFVRFYDMAGTADDGDWTVGTLMAEYTYPSKEKLYVIHDIVRGQWDSGGVDIVVRQTAKTDRQRFGFVKIREEREPGSSGLAVVNARRIMLQGYDYDERPAPGEIAWGPLAAAAKARTVKLLAGPWNYEWIEEMIRVPKHAHDDQAVSASGAFNELAFGTSTVREVPVAGW